jgi:hypothetical protein
MVLQVGGLDAKLRTMLCKNIIVTKSKEVKTGLYLAVSSKEGYGSKRALLPMIIYIYMYIYIWQWEVSTDWINQRAGCYPIGGDLSWLKK